MTWVDEGENKLRELMNEHQEERAKELDKAIKGSNSYF
jgi:hypothetical protein